MSKYAVKVLFDDIMIYVTENISDLVLQPLLFDTKEQAEEHAASYNKAVVVEYTEDKI